MKNIVWTLVIILLATSSFKSGETIPNGANTVSSEGFVLPVYTELPLGAVKPGGWLLHQLQIMRDGTTGHLDEVYAKVKDSNGWLGGTGDGWGTADRAAGERESSRQASGRVGERAEASGGQAR